MLNTTLSDLEGRVVDHFRETGKAWPTTKDAAIFLATEVAEVLDAIMREESGWSRNNEKETSLEKELQDVLMMLLVTAGSAGIILEEGFLDG